MTVCHIEVRPEDIAVKMAIKDPKLPHRDTVGGSAGKRDDVDHRRPANFQNVTVGPTREIERERLLKESKLHCNTRLYGDGDNWKER